ncbi:uncharacterized protein [Salminus brasiliensis]|uniref:uncharacterized protein isoform X2 n=1 Tax=Salminus brasiliensis TaxID=930266 RepID=UPI003B83881D
MLVKLLHVVMVILMSGLISALPLDADGSRMENSQGACLECPPGKYLASCHKCSKCPADCYMSQTNRERSCHRCYLNCQPWLNMQVVKNCSSVSDVVCHCMDGFFCSKRDLYINQCKICSPIPTSQSTSASANPAPSSQRTHDMWKVWIVIVVLLSILLIIVITLLLCRRQKKECLKNLVKRCSYGNQKGDVATMTSQISEPIRQIQARSVDSHPLLPTSSTSDCPTPQPASTEQPVHPPGNLGPLHIYGAGTVFVSLLNQFGQNGREKDEEHLQQGGLNESELHCPTSPALPLSTEENSRDTDHIFFPFQEQGKECHMSKEEGL